MQCRPPRTFAGYLSLAVHVLLSATFLLAPHSVLGQTESQGNIASVMKNDDCDDLWDGPIWGLLPGVLLGLIWQASRPEPDVSNELLVGAAGGAIAGLVIDIANCAPPKVGNDQSRSSSFLRAEREPELSSISLPAQYDPFGWRQSPIYCFFPCSRLTQAPPHQRSPFADPRSSLPSLRAGEQAPVAIRAPVVERSMVERSATCHPYPVLL